MTALTDAIARAAEAGFKLGTLAMTADGSLVSIAGDRLAALLDHLVDGRAELADEQRAWDGLLAEMERNRNLGIVRVSIDDVLRAVDRARAAAPAPSKSQVRRVAEQEKP
jgi:hypothetical protein